MYADAREFAGRLRQQEDVVEVRILNVTVTEELREVFIGATNRGLYRD